MGYAITDGHGFLAGKQIYRDPINRSKIISLWSSREDEAMRFTMKSAADHMLRKLDNPALRIVENQS